jgi:7-keto-8-aminopelargonate synthetase-like enzyme
MDYLINSSRAFIYSTALPPAVIAANLAALELLESEPFRRKTLLENAEFFRSRLEKSGLEVSGSSQIIPLILGDNRKALDLSRTLRDKGYWVAAIRPPTVPQGQARLRFSLSYHHSREMLENVAAEVS